MSVYCDRDDVEQVFGIESITEYATLDGDDSAAVILARINRAITFAGDEIDDVARKAAYQDIPLQTAAGSVPTTIENLAAVLAGVWLYEAKGSQDFDARSGRPSHRLYFMKRWARQRLIEIRDGVIKLDAQ